jgi:hypothetical protein
MRKTLLTIFLFFFVYPVIAQKDSVMVEQYCEVIATPRLLSSRVTVDIDFGDLRSIWKDNRLKDEDGRLVKFNTVIDALNFMGKDGWKLVNAFPIVTSNNTQVYHYVFKKMFLKSET